MGYPALVRAFTNQLTIPIGEVTHRSGRLTKDDISYFYSSVRFYETGVDEFVFLPVMVRAFTKQLTIPIFYETGTGEFGLLNNLYAVFDGEYLWRIFPSHHLSVETIVIADLPQGTRVTIPVAWKESF